jgi:hypothetical protein
VGRRLLAVGATFAVALSIVFALGQVNTSIFFSRVPVQWTGVITRPEVTFPLWTPYKVKFEIQDSSGNTKWRQEEFSTELGDVSSKTRHARFCVNGKKSSGFDSQVTDVGHSTICNDLDTRQLADTTSNRYTLLVTAYKRDGTTATARRTFQVKNYSRYDGDSNVEWVAPGGTCVIKASCTRANPYGVIQEAINDSTSSTTVIVKEGTYREALTIGTGQNGMTLVGQFGAFVDGSTQAVGSWTAEGEAYYWGPYTSKRSSSTGTVGSYGSPTSGGSGNCRDTTNKPCAMNDFVILKKTSDGSITYPTILKYTADPGVVATKPTIPDSGLWFGSGRIYVNFPGTTTPTDYTVYYADKDILLALSGSSVTVRGLTFQYSTRAYNYGGGTVEGHQYGQINVSGDNNLLENVVSRYARWSGLMVTGDNTVVRASKLINNRTIGYTGNGDSTVYESNEIAGNNNYPATEGATDGYIDFTTSNTNIHLWRAGFEAGGGKTSGGSSGDFIEHNVWVYNYVHNNGGPGIWPDFFHSDTLIYRNRAYNNAWNGIDVEGNRHTSGFTRIQENVAYENGFDYSWAGENPTYTYVTATDEANGAPDPPDWNIGSNILVRTSDLVDVYYNLSAWGGDGLGHDWEASRMSNTCPDYNTFLGNVNIQHRHNIGDENLYIASYNSIGGSVCNEASFEATSSYGAFSKVRTIGERVWHESESTYSGGATAGPSNFRYSFGQDNGGSTDDPCFFMAPIGISTWSTSACSFGNGTVIISQSERDTWLSDHGIPTSAESRPTSGPY